MHWWYYLKYFIDIKGIQKPLSFSFKSYKDLKLCYFFLPRTIDKNSNFPTTYHKHQPRPAPPPPQRPQQNNNWNPFLPYWFEF